MLFDGRIVSGITVFVAVAQSRSYSGAATQVGLTRSGVGKAIGRLEVRTGLRLFDRTSRALKLTDEGRTFLHEVRPILERLGHAARPSSPGAVKGRLRISSDDASGCHLILPAISKLFADHPLLKIDLTVQNHIGNLLADGIDAAVRFGADETNGLDRQLLATDRIVTCATPHYIDRFGMPQSPEDLSGTHTCIGYAEGHETWRFQNEVGDLRTVVPSSNVRLTDWCLIVSAGLKHLGVIRALECMVADHLQTGALLELMPAWNHATMPAYLFTPQVAYESAGLKAFQSSIKQCAAGPDLRTDARDRERTPSHTPSIRTHSNAP